MDNPRPEKVAVVDEVRERLDAASAAILTEYRGLTVKDIAGLRRTLREAGGEYGIYKNTLVRFAARDLGLADLEELLVGPTAIAFVDGDAAAVAKALRDYARTNPHLIVKGGVLGTKVLSAADTAALADLPSREVLLARIAGGLAAPMQQLAGLLQALPRNFAYGLKALVEKGGGGGADTAGTADAAPAEADAAPTQEAAPAEAAPVTAASSDDEPAQALATPDTDQPAPSADDVRDATGDAGQPAPAAVAEATDAESTDAGTTEPVPAAGDDQAAEPLATGETDQPAPTADDVREAVDESTQE